MTELSRTVDTPSVGDLEREQRFRRVFEAMSARCGLKRDLVKQAGFTELGHRNLGFGIAALHTGTRPATATSAA